ncbi:hypothetical protein CRUP_035413, partial [Coryphaenoides rupestris]
ELELKNVCLSAGDHLTVKGVILHHANRFQIDLGSSANDLALHFNPRFHDNHDSAVLVCNSKSHGCWGHERREGHNPLRRGEEVKIVVKLTGDMFKVELPGGQEVKFPNREGASFISYVGVGGDFKLSSFKISQ